MKKKVEFRAFVRRVGIDKTFRSWATTGELISFQDGLARIRPTDPEYIAAIRNCPDGPIKTVVRSRGEWWSTEGQQ